MGPGGEELRHRQIEANGLQFHVVEAGSGDRLALATAAMKRTAEGGDNAA